LCIAPEACSFYFSYRIKKLYQKQKEFQMNKRSFLTSILASLLAVVGLTASLHSNLAMAAEYKSEYKMSLVLGTAFPWGKGGEIWADLVRERTNGRINIKLYPGASLVGGDQTREFTAIRQGVIDMAIGSTINWSPQVKELNLFSLPFLMPNYQSIDALVKGPVGKELLDIIEKQGVVPLAWGENGFREISNSKKEIKKPEDLKGMKFRVVGSPIYNETFSALGANPTQMSWADTQAALASGAVDGQENPESVYASAKLYTVGQKYVTVWRYVADPLIFVVNKQVWESWTPQDREIVQQAAIDAGKQEVAIARKGLVEPSQPAWKDMEQYGVKVTYLTPEDRKLFVTATRDVYNKWKNQIGAALVDKAEKAVANAK
jgi:tripartite ATP-independent transporter DctP family solute receptor